MKNTILLFFILSPIFIFCQKTKVLDLNSKWKFTIGDREEYKNPKYDDSSWESIRVGTPWENEGFANYNGYAWYRYDFDGYDLKGFTNLMISLGYIDDVHEAYFNGTLIGFKGSFPPDFYTAYDAYNEYSIPPSAINYEGKNVIAIKVYDVYRMVVLSKVTLQFISRLNSLITCSVLKVFGSFQQKEIQAGKI